jgi:hypothetical protein
MCGFTGSRATWGAAAGENPVRTVPYGTAASTRFVLPGVPQEYSAAVIWMLPANYCSSSLHGAWSAAITQGLTLAGMDLWDIRF